MSTALNRLPAPLLGLLLIGALFGTTLLGTALLPATTYEIDPEASTMTISGTSTLHDWTCEVESLKGRLRVDAAEDTTGAASDTAGATVPVRALPAVDVQVPVEQIECGKSRMNGNLRDALKATSYPTILFSLEDATLAALPDSSDAWFQVGATGELIIAGTRRTVELDVRAERLADGRFRFVGETPITMTDYDVDPPSFMFGTVKTGDEVTVRFNVLAAPGGG